MKRINFAIISLTSICTLPVTCLVGCTDGEKKYVTNIEITNKPTSHMTVGQTLDLQAKVTPNKPTDSSISWKSNNPSVMVVDFRTGIITAIGVGEATITAIANGAKPNSEPVKDSVTIVVDSSTVYVTGIEISNKPTHLALHESFTLEAKLAPYKPTDSTIEWSSDKQDVIEVTQDGKIDAQKPGLATITAKARGSAPGAPVVKDSVTIKVDDPIYATEVQITSKPKTNLVIDQSFDLKANVLPENATDRTVKWSSDKSDVIEVTESGKITAKSEGDATITVKANGANPSSSVTNSISIHVDKSYIPVTNIEITDKPTGPMDIGQSFNLKATISPENATDKTITWTSEDKNKVSINSETGEIVAESDGTTMITAKANGASDIKAKIAIEVKYSIVYVTNIEIINKPPEDTYLNIGERFELKTSLTPSRATNKKVLWSSSNPNAISVDENGYVKANDIGRKKVQEATITATAEGSAPGAPEVKDSVIIKAFDKSTMTVVDKYGDPLPSFFNGPRYGSIKLTIMCIDNLGLKIKDVVYKITGGGQYGEYVSIKNDGTGSCIVTINAHTGIFMTVDVSINCISEKHGGVAWKFSILYKLMN